MINHRKTIPTVLMAYILVISSLMGFNMGYHNPDTVSELQPHPQADQMRADVLDGQSQDRGPAVSSKIESALPSTGSLFPGVDRAVEPIVTQFTASMVYSIGFVAFALAYLSGHLGALFSGVLPALVIEVVVNGVALIATGGLFVVYAYRIKSLHSGVWP